MASNKEKRIARWYFGGLASAGAACCTHPLDLLKVHLQTQQEGKMTLLALTKNIVKKQGVLALYNGLSASLLRQLTYSTTRFALYEIAKQHVNADSFYKKVAIAAVSGAAGGFVGTPADMVNVRMQNDIKLPLEQRRNYKHAVDGLYRVYREEGVARLFSGASTATSRAVLMTIGQLSFYDQIKMMVLRTSWFKDNMTTHFLCSLMAGLIATCITQPVDVMKTRIMNAAPGLYSGISDVFTKTVREGPHAFFKGIVPSGARILPFNIIVFMLYEQMRQNFGYLPKEE
ncbi:unnamed protein product [Acanthoscelides obtectus]|uniref:Mitochondrial dicarboxylate carrier n=1 Tax=Acanthoscelides obtectus TaxID=200917 RepID=A0A9P0JN43_ACAOB|nr:unnamed protein product [Acanthoscelides obtectus]CAK1662170.1 Mitochondrial dicarboxylate carrier [Acanthoscelides obtectus]